MLRKTGETVTVHADYLLQRKNGAIYNVVGNMSNNRITLNKDNTNMSILYNEKDNTLIIEDIVFHKQSDDNSVKTYLPKM